MKKASILLFLGLLTATLPGVNYVSAKEVDSTSVSSEKVSQENNVKIEALRAQIVELIKQLVELQQKEAAISADKEAVAARMILANNVVPRINYWWGKVNQHVDLATGAWVTDPDGVSGASLDKLAYCKKWYPKTISVTTYKYETLDSWKDRGNVNRYVSRRMSDLCVQADQNTSKPEVVTPTKPIEPVKPVVVSPVATDSTDMRIMFWWGKVNQHRDLTTGTWKTDPDGVSGANLDKLTYCKKWYPKTIAVEAYKLETINTWQDQGNVSAYTSTKMSDRCVQGQ